MTSKKRLSLVLALIFSFFTSVSAVYAENDVIDGDESNQSLDKVVIERSFSDINISALKCDWADGTTALPPAPWTIRTNYGWSNENAPAIKASYKNIGGNAPYLRGLWTHDGALGGGTYGSKQIYLTNDKYLSGNFAVELKYIPYKTDKFPNGNYYGAMPNYGTGVIQVGVGTTASWDFSFENNSAFPKGIKANIGGSAYSCNYAAGAGMAPTIGATVEELPDDFDGYHYVRLEFTTDNGATVLTRHGENTPWKKISGAESAMKALVIPESNTQLIFDLHRGIVGVDSVKVYKSSAEYPDYIADSLEIEKKSDHEYKTKVDLTNIGTDIPAKVCTRIYETEGSSQQLVDEIVDEYVGEVGQTNTYEQNINVPQDGKNYILKAYVMYKNNIIKSLEYGRVKLVDSNMTSDGKVELAGAVSIIENTSITFINKETQLETEGEYTIGENTAFISPKTRLDEGVEYEININGKEDKSIEFESDNNVKVLYNIDAEFIKNGGNVTYNLENRINESICAELFVVKYTGAKISGIEHETIELSANEKTSGQKEISLENDQTAKVFLLNNLSDHVIICDALTMK